MGNKGHSERNLFGGYTHYDSEGHKIGHSDPSFFGGYTNYDANGHKIGHSDRSFLGGYDHYDANGHKTGHSDRSFFGGYDHYDSSGKKTGTSDPNFFGGYSNNKASGGCYIATCVYGSYNCPEVWTLRRFRDYKLAESLAGRLFVKLYYAVSPTVVKLFGKDKLFRLCWRKFLDKWVLRLREKGYSDSPYNDRNW
jgi:hypothetical protein